MFVNNDFTYLFVQRHKLNKMRKMQWKHGLCFEQMNLFGQMTGQYQFSMILSSPS